MDEKGERAMSNNELLLQMSQLLDAKLQLMHAQLREEMRKIGTGLEKKIQGVETRLEEVNLTLENNLIPRLQNIETCYLDTYNRYISEIERVHALEADVSILKKVVQEHSDKLKEIS